MDDLTLLKSFRAERVRTDAEARAEIRRELEDRFDAAAASPSPVAFPPRGRSPIAPRRHLLRRRRAFAFGGALALAAALAGILVLSSGPTAQPAAAEILHETAQIAASSDAPTGSSRPGPRAAPLHEGQAGRAAGLVQRL
jgi:hypothetical protein